MMDTAQETGGRVLFRDGFTFEVSPVKIREFATALWDANPAFIQDCERVPLTFAGAISQMAARPHGAVASGFEVSRSLHGQENIRCHRQPVPGEDLHVEVEATDGGLRQGRRGGRMRRVVINSQIASATGEPVATVERILLEAESEPGLTRDLDHDLFAITDEGLVPRQDPLVPQRQSPWELPAGAMSPALVVGPLTRADFVRYAGASGDFTAIHYDDHVARKAGLPAVFAMGMLSGGFLGHLLTDWLDIPGAFELRLRFVSPVFSGETLTCTAELARRSASRAVFAARAVSGGTEVTRAELILERDR